MDSLIDDLDAPWEVEDVNVPAPPDEDEGDFDDYGERPEARRSRTPPAESHDTPSSSEMAGDGAVGGDGIDEPGWD